MISCYHLTIDGVARETPLLDDVTVELDDGDWTEFVGPTGAGKSLLYSVFALELRPTDARLIVAGRNLQKLDAQGFAQLRRQIGTCRQVPEFLEERSVIENLVLPLVVRGETNRAAEVGERLLETAGCFELRDRPVCDLSAGQRRLIGMLRAAIGTPRGVFVDGGLDGLTGDSEAAARRALRDANEEGSTVVLFGREPSNVQATDAEMYRVEAGQVEPA